MFMEEDVFCGPQVVADLKEVPFYSRSVSEVPLSTATFDASSLKSSRYISIYLFNLSHDFRISSLAGFLIAYFPAKGISSISKNSFAGKLWTSESRCEFSANSLSKPRCTSSDRLGGEPSPEMDSVSFKYHLLTSFSTLWASADDTPVKSLISSQRFSGNSLLNFL